MVLTALTLLIWRPSIREELNSLAVHRDVSGLMKYAAPGSWSGRNPFTVIKTNGAYETGKFGWTALEGEANGKRYIVLSTPLTSEDIGERLFETDGDKLTKYIDEREDFGWRIESHSMSVSFDIPGKKVKVNDRLRFRHTGEEGPLIFRMGPNYVVQSIQEAKGLEKVPFTQLGGIVFLPDAKDGQTFIVTYEGTVDKPNYAGSITPSEAMLTNDYWYPMIARKPSPYGITVFGPEDWTVVAQGEMVGTRTQFGTRVTSYRMDLPCTYWSLNVAPYKKVENTIDGRKFRVWSKTTPEPRMNLQTELYPLILKTYEKFAKFPFSGYGACITPLYGGGALEAYSFATYGYYPGEDSHEPAHTWWGGLINNTYLNSLWNESFADWSGGFYGRNAELGNKAERGLAFIQTPDVNEDYDAAPLNDSPPDIGPASTTLGYGKGAFVLQMLEQEIGPEKMLKACQEWIKRQDPTRGGEWEDFEVVVQDVAGKDVKWFFDEWVRRPGYPRLGEMTASYKQGNAVISIPISNGKWKITADVLLKYKDGRQAIMTATNEVVGNKHVWKVPPKEKPVLVSFDPWRRVVRKFESSEEPTSISRDLRSMNRYTAPAQQDWLKGIGRGDGSALGSDVAGRFIVGSPETLRQMAPLCTKAGFAVKGNALTYKGTSVDLTKGGAIAVIDLPGGKKCAIGLGQIRGSLNIGRARLAVFDEYGRFLRGVTDPKTSGAYTAKL